MPKNINGNGKILPTKAIKSAFTVGRPSDSPKGIAPRSSTIGNPDKIKALLSGEKWLKKFKMRLTMFFRLCYISLLEVLKF